MSDALNYKNDFKLISLTKALKRINSGLAFLFIADQSGLDNILILILHYFLPDIIILLQLFTSFVLHNAYEDHNWICYILHS